MDFYDKMNVIKKEKRLRWPDIGAVVDKEQGTIRLAFKNKSLRPLEIEALKKAFFSNELLEPEKDDYSKINERLERMELSIARMVLDIGIIKEMSRKTKKS